MAYRVLLVDDYGGFLDLAERRLEANSGALEVVTETRAAPALDRLEAEQFDCVVCDYVLAETDGLAVLEEVRDRHPDLPFVLLTARGDESVASDAISAGVSDYVLKRTDSEGFELLANRIETLASGYRAEREAREAAERIRRVHERITDAVLAVDADWAYTYANDRAEQLLSTDAEDLVGRSMWDVYPQLEDHEFGDALRRAMEAQEPTEAEAYFEPLDAYLWVRAFPDADGISIYVRDVTDERRREAALERYERTLQAAGNPIFALDSDCAVETVNDRFVEFTGLDREAVLGADVSVLVADGHRCRVAEAIEDLDPDGVATVDVVVERADGVRRRCELDIALLPRDGAASGSVGVLRDVTEQRQREERLAVLDRVLRHNLRNKLTVVVGELEEVVEATDGEVGAAAGRAREEALALLAVSRKARWFQQLFERVDSPDGSVDLRTTVSRSIAHVEERFPDAEVEFDVADCEARTDGDVLEAALTELLDNALAHHEQDPSAATVRVTVRVADGRVVATVADDGPVIPREEREVVQRGREGQVVHGSGVGLWLTRWLVEYAGGELSFSESDLGGTAATVELPVSRGPTTDAPDGEVSGDGGGLGAPPSSVPGLDDAVARQGDDHFDPEGPSRE